jgi:hypothetical protein
MPDDKPHGLARPSRGDTMLRLAPRVPAVGDFRKDIISGDFDFHDSQGAMRWRVDLQFD